ncbi:MAG: amidohydrolase [Chloroflexi bacterium RBG_16_72_14]|nr:MAG: amidohydrolase [Chloroflexi bacterium RBG_16_72_14]
MTTGAEAARATAPHLLRAAAEAILPGVVEVRRRLHRRPEIGLHLPQTQAVIAEALRALGLEPRVGGSTTSVTTVIEGARPGPTILLRADMDGLPLTEDTGLGFASEVPGAMHACGHDTHVAMLLGAARLLAERRDALAGRVLLMFQPGEEGYHGARFMLDEGLLVEGAHGAGGVERAVAIHISTRYPSATIALRPGPLLASTDAIRATVRGRGGHASAPHLALDPIPTAAELVLALQAAVSRSVDAFDPVVLTIARISGGTTNNIIPERVEIEGTIRTTSPENRALMRDLVRRVAAGVAAAQGTEIDLEIDEGYPVTLCDPDVTAWVRGLAAELAGEAAVLDMAHPIMGGEDFSYVTQRVPGMMAFLGARPASEDPATAPQNHSNLVVFDEPSMALGVALYAAAAIDFLGGDA